MSQSAFSLEDTELSEDEAKKLKLLHLYENIAKLKKEISSKILKDLKQCRKSCDDANSIVGALHDTIKKL